jgi:hypothetical protein
LRKRASSNRISMDQESKQNLRNRTIEVLLVASEMVILKSCSFERHSLPIIFDT